MGRIAERTTTPPDELDDRESFSALVRWMNEQRKPGREPYVWRHQNVRGWLETLEVPLLQAGPGCKLYFLKSDLRRKAPHLAAAYLHEPLPSRFDLD